MKSTYKQGPVLILLILLCISVTLSCVSKKEESKIEDAEHLIDVRAVDFKFEMPAEIPSGWSTFRFKNDGMQEHFLYLYKLPDNKTYDQFLEEAMVPFGTVWYEYIDGDLTREEATVKLGEEMAGWFFTDIIPSGGPALTEPGETAITTVHLEPGTYVAECYVKMPDGSWHIEMGMQQEFTVTQEENNASPPNTDVSLTLSNYELSVEGEFTSGLQTVAVHIKENPEGIMLHDINLFRLDDTTNVDEIIRWMDWMDPSQFRAPAPGYSIGGVEHLVAGKTGYMTVDLQPGRYALISEMYALNGVSKVFTVE